MNRLVVVAGIVVAAFVAFFVARYFLEEGDELSGTWAVVGMDQKGRKIPVQKLPYKAVTFGKGQLTWKVLTDAGERDIPGPFVTDTNKSPKQMDLTIPDPEGMVEIAAIYETSGDEMRISIGMPRPRDFATKTGTILYLKRQ